MSSKQQAKVVLVTGASSGIGQGIARHLAKAGHRVFGTQRSQATETNNGVELISMDVDTDDSVTGGIATLMERTGRLDAVVNNAGWALMGPVEETTIAEARAQMESNFFGVLRLCHAVLPIMRRQGSGYIVNISSLGGVFGMPFSGLYSASKFAVEGLSESLRLETRKLGIRVVLIEPGDTQSKLPFNRRTTKATTEPSPYSATFDRFKAQQAKDEAKAPSPERIAAVVERVLNDPSPRLRYSVGMPGQRVVLPLKRLLPYPWFEGIVSKAMGV
jgi:NAD(P)-dependent dehydrogenase (short-subunit alcohol dehydrogenase family)